MRGATLPGSLAFAAFAALGAIPWTMAVVPRLWPYGAVMSYLLAAVVLYLLWIAPTLRQGVRAALLAVVLTAVVAVVAPGLSAAVFGAAVVLAAVRSSYLYRSRPARALLLEGVLLLGGLLFARALADASPLGVGLGVWGFFLVQCLFTVAGGVRERPAEEPVGDPFTAARQKVLAVMEEG